ncbi:tRNA lysidine(34) synthetase TilS [Buchnera aphidicola]|uniref:tRNA lysidine(34) synthetase TilS n=1 Tax=Buchnera aphidicola TaxID=9 RepID=UPI003463A3EE
MIKELEKMLYKKKYFLICYSGGLDSTVLLHLLLKLKKTKKIFFRAIHINHKLNINSDNWSDHCKKECKKYNVPIVIKNVNLNLKKNNIESKARSMRYKEIYKNLLPKEIILTAHNLNDQCETFLLALKRGSGPKGLSSMSTYKKIDNIIHIRPLLQIDRNTLEKWAKKNKLKWIEDNSNWDTNYDRNFLRRKIIPILKERWPKFIKNCTRSAKICSEQEEALNYFTTDIIKKTVCTDKTLNITNLKYLKKEILNIILRHWISLHHVNMPSYKGLYKIFTDIINSKKSASPKISFKKYEIRRYRKKLYLLKPILPSLKNRIIFWHKTQTSLALPNQLGYVTQDKMGVKLPSPEKKELVNIRFQANGSFLIEGQKHKKKLKKIWQLLNIPIWQRENIPLLFYNNRFIGALGIFTIKNKNIKVYHYWYLSWCNYITKQ